MRRFLLLFLLTGCVSKPDRAPLTGDPNYWPVGSTLLDDNKIKYTLIRQADVFEIGKPVGYGLWTRPGSTRLYRTGILPKENSAATMVLVPEN